jgi:hypothetical protein
MKQLLLVLFVAFLPLQGRASIVVSPVDYAHLLHCDFQYMGMPAARVDLGFWSDNSPQASLQLAFGMGSSSEKKTVTPVPLAAGERAHIIVSKEVPNGSLELILYSQPQAKGETRLINHQFTQEFWGRCHAKN